MFRNYILIALRNLLKQKGYSAINILGLSIGMTCCLLILLWVADELSYDRFHEKADRLYRVVLKARLNDKDLEIPVSCAPLAEALVREMPEVESAARLRETGNFTVRYGDRVFNETRFFFADSNLFTVLSAEWLDGNSDDALRAPNSLVLTDAVARKYFGTASAVGKLLTIDGQQTYKVTGVVREYPSNSHLHFDFLASRSSRTFDNVWLSNNDYTYVAFHPGRNPEEIKDKLAMLVHERSGPLLQQIFGTSFEEFEKSGGAYGFYFQPVVDIHLHSRFNNELEPNGNIVYVYVFSIIAVFILAIAVINFMNLATARSARRAKEVGIRKAVGSGQRQLIQLFMTESILVSCLAMGITVILIELVLPSFNQFTHKTLAMSYLERPWQIGALIAFAVFVGLLAGSYPSLFLSAFSPIKVLKGELRHGSGGAWLRSGLVVFQFAISVILIVGTLVVYRQLNFVQNKDLGFQKEQVLVVDNTWLLQKKRDQFKSALKDIPGIASVGYTSTVPGKDIGNSAYVPEGRDASNPVLLWHLFVDMDALDVLGIEMAQGRKYSLDFPADSTKSLMVNETAAALMGFTEPLGKKVMAFMGNTPGQLGIVGTVKDFHFQSLHETIKPLAIRIANENQKDYAVIRIAGSHFNEIIDRIQDAWSAQTGGEPFTYFFLDDNFDSLYRAETAVGRTLLMFSGLGIFIACLGLFGLSNYAAEQRTKEIGIRKALGASVFSVVGLLSREFLMLVGVATLIAWPLAYLAMDQWLENFAYRMSIGIDVFVISGVSAIVIAVVTVSYQAWRAASANPVHALKYE